MSETSEKCNPTISEASPNAISSPALGDGATPSDSPDGRMIDLFGRAVAHVSPSRQQVGVKANRTRVISGLSGGVSSSSVRLQSYLVSRLLEKAEPLGSTLFHLTWKRTLTPLRRPLYVQRALALRTRDRDCILWVNMAGPTPTAGSDHAGGSVSEWGGTGSRRIVKKYLTQREVYGRINPGLPCWLMGYPSAWLRCADLVTVSSRKSRKHSSKRT